MACCVAAPTTVIRIYYSTSFPWEINQTTYESPHLAHLSGWTVVFISFPLSLEGVYVGSGGDIRGLAPGARYIQWLIQSSRAALYPLVQYWCKHSTTSAADFWNGPGLETILMLSQISCPTRWNRSRMKKVKCHSPCDSCQGSQGVLASWRWPSWGRTRPFERQM